jgi:hypothetical protein
MERWNMYQKICILSVALQKGGIAEGDVKFESEVESLSHSVEVNSAEKVMRAARYAHECKNDDILVSILQSLRELCEQHVRKRTEIVESLLSQRLTHAADKERAQEMLSLNEKSRQKWPTIQTGPRFPVSAPFESDGFFECAKVDGKRIYRPITPRVVSLLDTKLSF